MHDCSRVRPLGFWSLPSAAVSFDLSNVAKPVMLLSVQLVLCPVDLSEPGLLSLFLFCLSAVRHSREDKKYEIRPSSCLRGIIDITLDSDCNCDGNRCRRVQCLPKSDSLRVPSVQLFGRKHSLISMFSAAPGSSFFCFNRAVTGSSSTGWRSLACHPVHQLFPGDQIASRAARTACFRRKPI